MPHVKREPPTDRSHRHRSPHSKHKKSKKKRRSSTESISDDSTDGKNSLQARLEQERARKHAEKERRKAEMKARETPEEKRARRLAKKLAKEQKVKLAMGWSQEDMGYTNVDNPFGDTQLTEPFVWDNKLKKQGLKNVSKEEIAKNVRQRIEQNRSEVEYYRSLREEREQEREEREKEARDRESVQFQEWSKQEDSFHLTQAMLRSKIRIQEGRPKPIDLLFWFTMVRMRKSKKKHDESNCIKQTKIGSVSSADTNAIARRYTQTGTEEQEELGIEMNEPQTYIEDLTQRDMEDLLTDIKVIRQVEAAADDEAHSKNNKDFWDDICTIVQHRLDALRKADPTSEVYEAAGRRQGIHSAVDKDLDSIFTGKSYAQLALLETTVRAKVKSQEEGVDVAYWESLLVRLKLAMAESRLRERHTRTLEVKLEQLKHEQVAAGVAKAEPDDLNDPDARASVRSNSPDVKFEQEQEDDLLPEEEEMPGPSSSKSPEGDQTDEPEITTTVYDIYVVGGYSPVYQQESQLEPGTEIVDENEDSQRTEFARQQFRSRGVSSTQSEALLHQQAATRGDEATFAVEAPLEHVKYLWSDKYRPRKPRYFNRVHTGFEWNKYNQTHYDQENPPPKIVQGYRFNIFYPDLLDPSKAPIFELIPCDDPDFAVLRFKAGPPYEDIAFKVVNREWECAHRKGYRCQFQNGIFQLWFHFKKYRYRR